MAWIDNLYSRLIEFRQVIGLKLNHLNDIKENKSNKKNHLNSDNPEHYPNIPAVRQGIQDAIGNISNDFIPNSQKAQPWGVATLDSNGKVPPSQLPDNVNNLGNTSAPIPNWAQMMEDNTTF